MEWQEKQHRGSAAFETLFKHFSSYDHLFFTFYLTLHNHVFSLLRLSSYPDISSLQLLYVVCILVHYVCVNVLFFCFVVFYYTSFSPIKWNEKQNYLCHISIANTVLIALHK